MKTFLHVSFFMFFLHVTRAQSTKDLPSPVANLQNLPAGSYVIPMDNSLQANTAGFFNLKSYGLIIHLLNNGVKVKWAIRAGKAKDASDFSGTAIRLLPTSTGLPSVHNFLAGPFVISAPDTSGVAALVQSFYTNNALTGNDQPAVYRLSVASLNVDIRHDLSGFVPKAAILNDGTNTSIHIAYMTKASVPVSNYEVASATDLVRRCYTFASEPHISSSSLNTSFVDAVRVFTSYGGNFLAQCEAIESYENHASGRFQTTAGISKVNMAITSAQTNYPNTDLSFNQYQGMFSIRLEGSVRNWVLNSGSVYKNNGHNHATGPSNTPIGASVSKMNNAAQAGGLVFYLGNHDFSSISMIESINGIRMYMNAFLTPTSLNRSCAIGSFLTAVLSTTLKSFTVKQRADKAHLAWTADKNSSVNRFVIERSTDGISFSVRGSVAALTVNTVASDYHFTETIQSELGSILYYRLRMEDQQGKIVYSEIRSLRINRTGAAESVELFPNPVVNQLSISVPEQWVGKQISYEVIDLSGIKQLFFNGLVNTSSKQLDLSQLKSGFYYIKMNYNGEQITRSIYKK